MILLKLLRTTIGYIIIALNAIVKPKVLKRSKSDQEKANNKSKKYILYEFYLCPFCVKVRRHLTRLNIQIETRDAKKNETYRDELLNGGGRIKVPCLRIQTASGYEWMYESSDINDYLSREFG